MQERAKIAIAISRPRFGACLIMLHSRRGRTSVVRVARVRVDRGRVALPEDGRGLLGRLTLLRDHELLAVVERPGLHEAGRLLVAAGRRAVHGVPLLAVAG